MEQFLIIIVNDRRAEQPIARITQTRHDISLSIQFFVNTTNGDLHIRVVFQQF